MERKGAASCQVGSWNLYVSLADMGPLAGEAQLVGHPRQIGQRRRPDLSHYVAAAELSGDFAYPDVGGDLLIEAAGHNESQYLALA